MVVPAASEECERVRAECERVLDGNWREGARGDRAYAFTAPSPDRYPWQWYWDSCLVAVARRRLDPGRARRELESLLAAQQPDGFIGHTIFWGRPLHGARRLFYNVASSGDLTTRTIQPPLLAWAWRIAVGDPGEVAAIRSHHDWIARHRDLDGDGLVWIIQPDESGMDASPVFDAAWGWRSDGRPGFALLVHRNRRLGFSARRVAGGGGPVVCDVTTNVAHALSTLALGRPSVTPRLVERLYDERSGRFRPVVRPETGGTAAPLTWAALSPLALPDLPDAIGRRLVEEHLLDDRRFWSPVPPPSVALDDPAFTTSDRRLGLRQYWRGPTWINAAWLVWLGLVRLGYETEAAQMAARLRGAVARSGLREYYHPLTGAGMGAEHFAWSALILELIDPDPAAATSYLAPAASCRD
jgi:hypothetical protein